MARGADGRGAEAMKRVRRETGVVVDDMAVKLHRNPPIHEIGKQSAAVCFLTAIKQGGSYIGLAFFNDKAIARRIAVIFSYLPKFYANNISSEFLPFTVSESPVPDRTSTDAIDRSWISV